MYERTTIGVTPDWLHDWPEKVFDDDDHAGRQLAEDSGSDTSDVPEFELA